MKRILAAGFIAALASVGLAANASAAPAEAACFGQIHKLVNSGAVGVDNVGQFVKSVGGGQMKNEVARGLCAG